VIDRQTFIGLVGGSSLVALLAVPAQQTGKVPRIGWLTNSIVHTSNVSSRRIK